ncbi:hypothetical protein ACWD5B_38560 [Streptomyces tanashiensis]|uniref:hypothetical protein n=1 Tax=Streptomyces tanashiensis TaxID=67367 RepID=UPI00368DFFC9
MAVDESRLTHTCAAGDSVKVTAESAKVTLLGACTSVVVEGLNNRLWVTATKVLEFTLFSEDNVAFCRSFPDNVTVMGLRNLPIACRER